MEITLDFLARNLKPAKSFCPLVFGHYHHDYNSSKICCHANATVPIDKIRATVFDGNWSPACQTCKSFEDSNIVSYRQRHLALLLKNPRAVDILQKSVEAFKKNEDLVYYSFQLTLSNICNYACVMCGPSSSSIIAKNLNSLPLIRQTPLPDNLTFPEDCYVAFSGGEPFLDPVFLTVLKKIPSSATVTVTSNGSIYNELLLAELDRFRQANLTISIDGLAEVYEKIRVGGIWAEVDYNVKQFASRLKTPLLINTVVQKANLASLPEIAHWYRQYRAQCGSPA